MVTIDLNCDMGEGMPNDALLMPLISSASIACGFHAGDADTMRQTVDLAVQHGVSIGAHPGFANKESFGRKEVHLSEEALTGLVQEQIWLLQQTAAAAGGVLRHVKPHGALYNMSAREATLAATIAKAVYAVDRELVLFGLSGSHSISEAKKRGLATASEVFADRSYLSNGSLTPRSDARALIASTELAVAQVLQMIRQKTVTSIDNKTIPIVAETICLHGDGAQAVAFATAIRSALIQDKVHIKTHYP